jgi:hypothetical protein
VKYGGVQKSLTGINIRSGSSDTSEGSMPEEQRELSPIKDEGFQKLQTFLADTMAGDGKKLTQLTKINISNKMAKMLQIHFQSYAGIKQYMESKSLESCNYQLVPHLLMIMGGKMNPTDFKMYSLTDVIQRAHKFFNVRQEYQYTYSDENFKGMEIFFKDYISADNKLPSDQVDAAVNQFLVGLETAGPPGGHFDYERIMNMWDATGKNNPEMFISRIATALKTKCGDFIAGFEVRQVVEWVARYCHENKRPAAKPSRLGSCSTG